MTAPRPDTIADIKARHRIVDILADLGVELPARWDGQRDVMINCPCHEDRTPSCVIHPDTDRYHCFGCGAHGDVIQLIQDTGQARTVGEAIAYLDGRSAQTPVRTVAPVRAPAPAPVSTSLERVPQINDAAWQLFTSTAATARAERYLRERGIDVDAVRDLTRGPVAGYTPAARNGLTQQLTERGFTATEITDAGWARRDRNGRLVDRFHRRIVFPIRTDAGQVLGSPPATSPAWPAPNTSTPPRPSRTAKATPSTAPASNQPRTMRTSSSSKAPSTPSPSQAPNADQSRPRP